MGRRSVAVPDLTVEARTLLVEQRTRVLNVVDAHIATARRGDKELVDKLLELRWDLTEVIGGRHA